MRIARTCMAAVGAVAEIGLSVVSFFFFKAIRFCLRRIARLVILLGAKDLSQWRVAGAEFLNQPLVLPFLMTEGPRWNTHAITANAGPLKVTQTLSLQMQSVAESAQYGAVLIHRYPDLERVAFIPLPCCPDDDGWKTLHLDRGRYALGLRYYQWSDTVALPTIRVDGLEQVEGMAVRPDVNGFFDQLQKRRNMFYLLLNYYVFVLLKYRHVLPADFVHKELLPVGNPGTRFYYGLLEAGQSISCACHQALLDTHDVYFTLYDRSSFPVLWYQIKEGIHVTPISRQDGFYLLRVCCQTTLEDDAYEQQWIRICVQEGCL